jgi:uncharacterized protein
MCIGGISYYKIFSSFLLFPLLAIINMIRRIKFCQYKAMRWKNGKGTTTQLFRFPDVPNYDWRISCANVGDDGPFSQFPGYDRSLSIINGSGMTLSVGSTPDVTITKQSNPFDFSGDDDTMSRLINGPLLDFNVICRRGKIRKAVSRVTMGKGDQLFASLGAEGLMFIYPYRGYVNLSTHADSIETTEGDSYMIESCKELVQLHSTSGCDLFLVRLWDAPN